MKVLVVPLFKFLPYFFIRWQCIAQGMEKSAFSTIFGHFINIDALQRKIRQKIKNPPRTVPSFLFSIQFKRVDIKIEKKL